MPRISRRTWLRALALILAAVGVTGAPAAAGPHAAAGPYRVEVTTDPPVIPVGRAQVFFTLTGPGDRPVEGAHVRAIAQMPGMSMGEREAEALPVPGRPGVYSMPASFSMEGAYEATVKITGPQGAHTAVVPLRTGLNTATPSGRGLSPLALLPWLLGLGAAGFVAWRMARTGQRVHWAGILNRQVLGGLALLAMMVAGAVWAVRTFRRPGAMTPIEAQGMEMSTPAPPGTAPVELAVVRRGTVQSTVRYTGQAVGFLEQEVSPRVRGYILWMPFYAGDRVRRGQVLARLDTSEVAPQVAERRAAVAMAEQGVAVAAAEVRQAQAAANQARAEVRTREGVVAEAQSGIARARGVLRESQTDLRTASAAREEAEGDFQAAQAERGGVDADLAAARTGLPDAEAQLQAARADQRYWAVQIERTAALLREGAVSDEEFRRERAQAENADAKVRQALARLEQVQSLVRAAEARARKADAQAVSARARAAQAQSRAEGSQARIEQAQAEIPAAEARLQQARGDVAAQQAAVRQAESLVAAARQRVRQAETGVRQARATLGSATTAERYTEIFSQVDGVVTQRVVSPGTLVNPGQSVLRVAQVSPIRLQASVAEADLARIRPGALVMVRGQAQERSPVASRITSVAPLIDPGSRTGLVETLLPNRDMRFVPGQYVVMEISVGRREDVLRVPTRALRWQAAASEGAASTAARPYVWVADAASPEAGQYTARRVEVRVGLTGPEETEVLSGLQEGDRVVVAGQDALQEGTALALAGEDGSGTPLVPPSGAAPPRGGPPHGGHEGHGAAPPATGGQDPGTVSVTPVLPPTGGGMGGTGSAPPAGGGGMSSGGMSSGGMTPDASDEGMGSPGMRGAGRMPAGPGGGAMGRTGGSMGGSMERPRAGGGMGGSMGGAPGAGMGTGSTMGGPDAGMGDGMGASGSVPGLPPRGGVPRTPPAGARPAPRSTFVRPASPGGGPAAPGGGGRPAGGGMGGMQGMGGR